MSVNKVLIPLVLLANLSLADNNHNHNNHKQEIIPADIAKMRVTNPFTGETAEASKGTLHTTLHNVAKLNKLLTDPKAKDDKQAKNVIKFINSLIPSIKANGLFDLFRPTEWLDEKDPNHYGRSMVAILYLQHHPKELDSDIKSKLRRLHDDRNTPLLVKEEIERIANLGFTKPKVSSDLPSKEEVKDKVSDAIPSKEEVKDKIPSRDEVKDKIPSKDEVKDKLPDVLPEKEKIKERIPSKDEVKKKLSDTKKKIKKHLPGSDDEDDDEDDRKNSSRR